MGLSFDILIINLFGYANNCLHICSRQLAIMPQHLKNNIMKTHLILREKALENFGNKEEFNKAVQKIEEDFCILTMKPIDFYAKLYNLSLTNKK